MLEVRQSGGKTFYQRYTDERGRERQYKIGPADVITLDQARKKARVVLAQAVLGTIRRPAGASCAKLRPPPENAVRRVVICRRPGLQAQLANRRNGLPGLSCRLSAASGGRNHRRCGR